MEKKTKSLKFLRQRKMMLILPVLVIPFLALGFHAMGGGKGTQQGVLQADKGLNTELPGASKKDERRLDKMGLYAQAEKDSLQREKDLKSDPYSLEHTNRQTEFAGQLSDFDAGSGSPSGLGNNAGRYTDPNEQKIYEKLSALKASLAADQSREEIPAAKAALPEPSVNSKDVDRLEQMMQMMQSGTGDDPEMAQINSTLERILDIQHPDRVQQRLRKSSEENKGQVYAVSTVQKEFPVSLLDQKSVKDYAKEAALAQTFSQPEESFWGLEEENRAAPVQNAIEAVIHESQTVTSGSTVKLRLLNDIYISGQKITAGNFVFGTASLNGERLSIEIPGIRTGSSLYPVQLSAYDMDGLEGIRIPGAITRDVAKQSGDQALGSLGMGIYDPSIGAQAASAGITLGKSLLSKKIKLVRVELKAGYKVLLVDEKQKTN
ncbi:conjugative transposon protein TraM [Pedobacter panaciterrae]|uniref:conjugative transposon protein TraM n=1 Tax=Pedobacter panaciterrae TaxID=363849 RepID=UPI002598B003|nr:conjugative transposon protein TraM [uncultured Pedobacter sp.]